MTNPQFKKRIQSYKLTAYAIDLLKRLAEENGLSTGDVVEQLIRGVRFPAAAPIALRSDKGA